MNYGKIDKNKFMTLENTVDLLIDAVNQHYDVDRVLANFGIKVLGTKSNPDELPTPAAAFGDAYLVSTAEDGEGEPYDVYIWTRYDSNETDPQYGFWLNIGLISTVGPQGPQGKTGDTGPRGESTRWYVGNTVPLGNYNIGDMLLLTNGDIYMYGEGGWGNPFTNIKGTPGKDGINGYTPYIQDNYWYINGLSTGVRATGLAGANGTPGTAIIIVGKRDSVDDLPDPPTSVPRNYGYLVNVNGVEQLYFIAGIEGEEHWEHIDYSGNGTIVTTDGTAQASWDTNTKVDKIDTASRVYCTDPNGNQVSYPYGYSAVVNQIPLRTANGNISVPPTPGSDNSAASKKYVDDLAATKVSTTNNPYKFYGTNSTGDQTTWGADYYATSYTVGLRGNGGTLFVGPPTDNKHATTKKYVDDLAATKLDKTDLKNRVYCTLSDGTPSTIEYDSAVKQYSLMYRYTNGRCKVGEPVTADDCATKGYVDSKVKVATFLSAQGQVLNITPADLPGITSNTSIEVTASFGDTATLPSIALSLGSTDLTQGNYANIDKVNPYTSVTSFKLIYLDNQFIAPKKEPSSDQDDAAYGTTLTIGKVDTTSGQTRLTVVYR